MLVARRHRFLAYLVVALGAAKASRAHAAGPVSLRWSAPAECPSGDDVLAEVDRLLGLRKPGTAGPLDVVAEVERKDDGTYVVRLEIPGTDGPRSREVSAVSCSALGQATALILAMTIDPEAALSAPPAPHSPGPTPPRQTSPPPLPPAIGVPSSWPSEMPRMAPLPEKNPSPDASSRREQKPPPDAVSLLFALCLRLSGDVGSLPGPSAGFGGALGIYPGRLRIQFGGSYFLERSGSISTLPKAGTLVNLGAFQGSSGYAFRVHRNVEIEPHVRFDVGRFQATSFGVSQVGQGAGVFIGMGIGGAVSLRLADYVWVSGAIDGMALLEYPQFMVTGVGIVHQPSVVVGRLSLALEVRF